MARNLEEKLKKELRRKPQLVVTDMKLDGVDLSQRALIGVEFRNCELSFSKFTGADLSLTRFINCNLYCADFTDSVLYTTWFYDCNLTKADFKRAYLLGFRLKNVDITKTAFDDTPLVGLERKSQDDPVPGTVKVPLLGILPCNARSLETGNSGIRMAGYKRSIVFLSDDGRSRDAKYRTRLRAAETAKYLKAAHAENGYEPQAARYYVAERRQRRKALHGSILARAKRIQDFLFGDLVWRYGSSIMRPILALSIVALFASAVTYLAPQTNAAVGLFSGRSTVAYSYQGWRIESATSYLNVLYFYLTAPAGGSQDLLSGWVKVVFVVYLLTALWLIALIFEASTRRLGRSV